jgi:hypothetical protein
MIILGIYSGGLFDRFWSKYVIGWSAKIQSFKRITFSCNEKYEHIWYLMNVMESLEDEPIYSTQRIIQSDFDDKQMFE